MAMTGKTYWTLFKRQRIFDFSCTSKGWQSFAICNYNNRYPQNSEWHQTLLILQHENIIWYDNRNPHYGHLSTESLSMHECVTWCMDYLNTSFSPFLVVNACLHVNTMSTYYTIFGNETVTQHALLFTSF